MFTTLLLLSTRRPHLRGRGRQHQIEAAAARRAAAVAETDLGKLRVAHFRIVRSGATAVCSYVTEEEEGYYGQVIHARTKNMTPDRDDRRMASPRVAGAGAARRSASRRIAGRSAGSIRRIVGRGLFSSCPANRGSGRCSSVTRQGGSPVSSSAAKRGTSCGSGRSEGAGLSGRIGSDRVRPGLAAAIRRPWRQR